MNTSSSGKGAIIWVLLIALLGVAVYFLLSNRGGEVGPGIENEEIGAAVVSGSVTYLERIALPAGAVVTVFLEEIPDDAPATVIGTAEFVTQGENVPLPFEIHYDGSAVSEGRTYSVRATIEEDGNLFWVSDTMVPVITNGAPIRGVEVLLRRTVDDVVPAEEVEEDTQDVDTETDVSEDESSEASEEEEGESAE